jgi:hypothetical protein
MILLRKLVTLLVVLGLLFVEACNKKKPVLPPRSLAPTIAVELPDEIPETLPDEEPPSVAQERPPEPPPVKTKPKKTTRSTAKKTAPQVNAAAPPATQPPATNNNQTVASLRPPAPPDTAIAAAMPSADITKQKENTAQIVDATENSLKNLSRSLNDDEKATKTQIQSYLQQSRKATTDGDFERAYNLAKKAQLLADALIKK